MSDLINKDNLMLIYLQNSKYKKDITFANLGSFNKCRNLSIFFFIFTYFSSSLITKLLMVNQTELLV